MINLNFFSKKQQFFTLNQVLQTTNSKLEHFNDEIAARKIYEVATLEKATQNQLSFFHSAVYLDSFLNSQAGFCFMEEKFVSRAPKTMIAIINSNPYLAYSAFLSQFYCDKKNYPESNNKISPNANIETSAIIGDGTTIMSGAYIGHNVKVGKNCFIGNNSIIANDCQLGDNNVINSLVALSYCVIGSNVIIHSGAKIGQDGFGFTYDNGKMHKILQLGIVEIGDNVEIGANSCIDRGAIDNTKIGNQVKIDNLVQIGHNVEIGEGTVIAGCAGIAGSTKIGKFVQIGGGCRINGHITIGNGAKIAGGSGVAKSVDDMQIMGGFPAIPIKNWHRINLKLNKLLGLS